VLPEFGFEFEWLDYSTEIELIRYCSRTYETGTEEELAIRREAALKAITEAGKAG